MNLGTGVETSIRETAELVAEIVGFEGEIVWDTSMPNGQPRRSLDASRAEQLFGFEARTPLREGLERTVAWYRSISDATCPAAGSGRLGLAASRIRGLARALRRSHRPTRWSSTAASSLGVLVAAQFAAHRSRSGAVGRAQRLALLPGRRPDLARHVRLAADPPEMPWTIIGVGWPVALAPIMALSGPTFLDALPRRWR